MLIFQSEYSDYIKKNYILNAVNNLFPKIRTSKYSNEYYVNQILDCNLNYKGWSSFGKTLNKFTNKSKFHHKYLNSIYLKWSTANVFEIAYKNILKDNLDYNPEILKLNTDVTCISNMCGKENIGVNPEYCKKNVTKVAFLNTSTNNTPISINIIENNKIYETHKTLCHDKSSVQPLLNNIFIPINKDCIIDINADKAYISTETYSCANTKVNVITPPREKSITQTNKEIKKISEKIKIQELKNMNYNLKYTNASKNLINGQNKIANMNIKILKLNNYIDACKIKNENKSKTKRYLIENYFCSLKQISKIVS